MPSIGELQLGKQGLTKNFIETLRGYFNNHGTVKISVLRSAPEREDMKKLNTEILNRLGKNFTGRIIGFTLALKKWRRDRRA